MFRIYFLLVLAIIINSAISFNFNRFRSIRTSALQMIGVNDPTPSAMVDIITPTSGDYTVDSGVDFAEALKSHKKAVLFAVPGAFTPTCSEKHLPGFIALAGDMKAKGVDAVYCLSVNDKFVMKSWGQGTTGFAESGIKLVADGNGDYTKAIDLVKDATGGRMGLRCTRFAAILEDGVFKAVEVDEAGLEKSSAEAILGML